MAILIPSKGFEALASIRPIKPPPIKRLGPEAPPLTPPGEIGPAQWEGFAAPGPALPTPPLPPPTHPGETFRDLGGALGYGLGKAGEALGGTLGTAGEAAGRYLAAPTQMTYALTPEDTARAYRTGELPEGAVWTDSGPAYPAPRPQSRGEELSLLSQHPLVQAVTAVVPAPIKGPGVILGSRGVIKTGATKFAKPTVTGKVAEAVKPITEAAAPVVKEPWQMTNAEYHQHWLASKSPEIQAKWADPNTNIVVKANVEGQIDIEHQDLIRQALAKSKPVSPEVLKDYPDLAKAAKPKAVVPTREIDVDGKGDTWTGGFAEASPAVERLKALGYEAELVKRPPQQAYGRTIRGSIYSFRTNAPDDIVSEARGYRWTSEYKEAELARLSGGKPVSPEPVVKELKAVRPTHQQSLAITQRLAKERQDKIFREVQDKFAVEAASTETVSQREARRKLEAQAVAGLAGTTKPAAAAPTVLSDDVVAALEQIPQKSIPRLINAIRTGPLSEAEKAARIAFLEKRLSPAAMPPVEVPPVAMPKYTGVSLEASALLETLDAGGVPMALSRNAMRILREHGITPAQYTKMTPNEAFDLLRQKATVSAARPPVEVPPTAKPSAEATRPAVTEDALVGLADILDETKKSISLTKLERQISTLGVNSANTEGLDDLSIAITDYKNLRRAGMTPEDFASEKEASWEAIVEAVDNLAPVEVEDIVGIPKGLAQAEIDQWLAARKPPEGAGAPPKLPIELPPVVIGGEVPPPQGPLRTLQEAWSELPRSVPIRERLPEYWRAVKEALTDRHVGLRQLAERTNQPQLIDRIITQPASANIALERYRITYRDILAKAGDVPLDDVNAYLLTRHALDVFAVHPGRVAVGIYKTPQEAQAALDVLSGNRNLVEAAQIVQKRYQSELQRLVQEGFLESTLAQELAQKYPWYNPLRYPEILEEAAAAGKSFGGGAKNAASVIRRLSEKGIEATPERPLEALFDRLAYNEGRIQRNSLNREIIQSLQADPQLAAQVKKVSRIIPVAEVEGKTIFRARKGVERGELAFWEGGKLQVYEIPGWAYNELARPISPNEGIAMLAAINSLSRAGFVTYNPVFTVANTLSDSLQAFVNRGILPQQTIKSLGRWLRDAPNDPVLQAYRLAGARQMRFYGKEAVQAVREAEASGGNVVRNVRSFRRAIVDAIPRLGEAGEQANRVALFERQMNKYLPGWKSMNPETVAATPEALKAAAEAVEVTINFARGGWLVKHLDPLLLFFNASIQGTLLPYRFLRANPAARWRLGGLLGMGTALTAYNMSYPEYMDIPEWQRRGSVLVMLPSDKYDTQGRKKPNYIVAVPNTRELATFLGTQSYIMEKMFRDSPEGVGQFLATLTPLVTPLGGIPAPPVLEEMMGQAANWDFFRSRPLVPFGLQDEPAEKQFDGYTSRTAIELGKLIGQSPIRISSVVSGIFGGAGQAAFSVPDYIMQNFFPGEGPSAEVRQALAQVQALSPDKREAYLGTLPSETRKEVERQARMPEGQLPVVSAFQRRFAPGYGGEVFRTGIQNEKVRLEMMKKGLPKEILILFDKYDVNVPVPESSYTSRDRLHRFSDAQLVQYQELLVRYVTENTQKALSSPNWKSGNDMVKRDLLGKAITNSKGQARLAVMRESLQGEKPLPIAPRAIPTPTAIPARPQPAAGPAVTPTPAIQGIKPPPIRRQQPVLQAPVMRP